MYIMALLFAINFNLDITRGDEDDTDTEDNEIDTEENDMDTETTGVDALKPCCTVPSAEIPSKTRTTWCATQSATCITLCVNPVINTCIPVSSPSLPNQARLLKAGI
jgi:hypothetical protein